MFALKSQALFLMAVITGSALGASNLAVGPNAVVPDGAPLPSASGAHIDSACDNLGSCGDICPNVGSVFVGDFAYDESTGGFVVVDVVTPDGIFRMGSGGCDVTDYASYAGVSQRGCAVDNATGDVYTASWNDQTIWHLDGGFNVLGSQILGQSYAGLAVDETNRLLYAATNASPDQLIEYSINSDGSVSATGNSWDIPWQATSDGFSAAALEYDDCSSTFMSINQDANVMEYFRLASGGLVGAGSCPLPQSFGWGFGLDFASVELNVADIAAFACDFPIGLVEPDPAICGSSQELGLAITGDCPGRVTLTVRGATPGGRVAFVYSAASGSFTIPSGYSTCPGTTLPLGGTPTLLTTVLVNSDGLATFTGNAPAAACGVIKVVGLDIATCVSSGAEVVQ